MTQSGRFQDLPARVGTAGALILLIGCAFYIGLWGVALLVIVAGGLLGFETAKMARADLGPALVFAAAQSIALAGLMANFFVLFLAAVIGIGVFTTRFMPHRPELAGFMALIAVVGLSAAFLLAAHFNIYLLIHLLMVAAFTDIGGYLGGRLLGGPKIVPRISPSKTWSGLNIGLLLGFVSGGMLLSRDGLRWLSSANVPYVSDYAFHVLLADGAFFPIWVVLMFVATVIFGDFLVSLVKRGFGVKDSGAILPGHGGVWDRFDGFGLGAFVIWLFAVAGVS
ncbi:MAG: phosphatidate cytidylyltransferase [Pseudomonadota bacterium]